MVAVQAKSSNTNGVNAGKQVMVPPIKTQGIKTRLVKFIMDGVELDGSGRWIEPFLGSGAVLFNVAPRNAIASDTNPHIIGLYRSIQDGSTTKHTVRTFLEHEGSRLEKHGASHYYEIRDRFNSCGRPLDFLFLNRSCFNGLVRFNSKGKFNTAFCKKPKRFSKGYVTKIVNQVENASRLLGHNRRWNFEVADWRDAVADICSGDFVYMDPPYHGRTASYYNSWSESDMLDLAAFARKARCKVAISTWYGNAHRQNPDIEKHFAGFGIKKRDHFYHIGPSESLRGSITEAVITNFLD